MKIDLKKCPKDKPQIVWGPDGDRYDVTTELEFEYIRCEIVRHRESGWKISYDGSYITINNDGIVEGPYEYFFPTREQLESYILEHGIYEEQKDLREKFIDVDVEYEDISIR